MHFHPKFSLIATETAQSLPYINIVDTVCVANLGRKILSFIRSVAQWCHHQACIEAVELMCWRIKLWWWRCLCTTITFKPLYLLSRNFTRYSTNMTWGKSYADYFRHFFGVMFLQQEKSLQWYASSSLYAPLRFSYSPFLLAELIIQQKREGKNKSARIFFLSLLICIFSVEVCDWLNKCRTTITLEW